MINTTQTRHHSSDIKTDARHRRARGRRRVQCQRGGKKSGRFQGNGHSQMLVVEHVFGHRYHSLKRVCALYLQQLGHGSNLDVQ